MESPTPIRILGQTTPGRHEPAELVGLPEAGHGVRPRIDDYVQAVAAKVRRRGLAAPQGLDHCSTRGCDLGVAMALGAFGVKTVLRARFSATTGGGRPYPTAAPSSGPGTSTRFAGRPATTFARQSTARMSTSLSDWRAGQRKSPDCWPTPTKGPSRSPRETGTS
jgi:hypothetical protein